MNNTENTPKMTASEAKEFTHTSDTNAMIAELRSCSCVAYESIFTYNRWRAQGFQVRKGEKGTQIVTYRRIKKTDSKGKDKSFSIPKKTTVFCSCQVDETK